MIAHLGNGSSMAALHRGKSIDTSMGFTPLEGLVMGTRSGDVDLGVLIYLLEQGKMSSVELSACLNKQSGLLGVSGSSEDMRDLLEKAPSERTPRKRSIFLLPGEKVRGRYAAALGGLDILVFAGGIGEHAPVVRERICAGLEFLGVRLDPQRNLANAGLVSGGGRRPRQGARH